VLSTADLDRIMRVEDVLEHFWNRGFMPEAMKMIHAQVPSMFGFMEAFHAFLVERQFSFLRHQMHQLFRLLDDFVTATIPKRNAVIHDTLIRTNLERADVKPKPWWTFRQYEFEHKSALMQRAHAIDPSIPLDDYFKYGVVTQYRGGFLVVLYRPSGKKSVVFK